MNRKLIQTVLSLLILSAILLGACAPKTTTEPAATVPLATEVQATESIATAAPGVTEAPAAKVEQDTVVVLVEAEPVSYDNMFTQSDADMALTIHEGLFRTDNKGVIVPAIAESIENIDPLTWEIKIKQGLVFHNDEPINADAVVFTFDRATKLFAAGLGDLTFAMGALRYEKVEKIDEYTVRITTLSPDPIITSHLVNPEFSILPPKYYSEHTTEEVTFAPVGAGGYKFVSYKAGEGTVLEAFDKYRLGKPPIDKIIVKAVPEVATRIAMLKAGSADLIARIPADLKSGIDSTPGLRTVVAESFRRGFVAIKQGRHPALADVRVRQALNYAFNCEEVAATLLGGLTTCRINVVNAPYNEPGLRIYSYDPDKANTLLDEAGWLMGPDGIRVKDGIRLSLNMDTTNGSFMMDKEVSQVLVEAWKAVGIEIADLGIIDGATSSKMRAKQGEGYRDLMMSSSGPDYTCQGDLLLVQKDSGSNRMSWSDDTFEEKWGGFVTEFDQSKWEDMCFELQEYVGEQAPVIWLYNEPALYGISDRIEFTPRPDGRLYLNLVLTGYND
jgi:peptide/nickel transport system substrate-binding protein